MFIRRGGAVPAGRLAKPVPGAASPPDPAPFRGSPVFLNKKRPYLFFRRYGFFNSLVCLYRFFICSPAPA